MQNAKVECMNLCLAFDAILWYTIQMRSLNVKIFLSALLGTVAIVTLVMTLRTTEGNLLGRILDGDELLRVQVESDFDRDSDIDFQDFTVFAAFYEEE